MFFDMPKPTDYDSPEYKSFVDWASRPENMAQHMNTSGVHDWMDPAKNMVWRGDQSRYVPYGQAFDGPRQMAPAGGWGPNRDAGGNWRGQGEPPQAAAARAAGLVTEDGINSPNGAAIAQEIATRRNDLRTALQNSRMARAAEMERRRGLYA